MQKDLAAIMPIESNDYQNFYQGTCAEYHVASLFYFAGYEASRISPDLGIDFVITNVARAKFSNDIARQAEVQVKSTILDETGAAFCIKEDELEFLCKGENRHTVFVLFHGFSSKVDHSSFDIYADQIGRLIDIDIAGYTDELMAREGRSRKSNNLASIFDFNRAKLTVFWLNSRQMLRARSEGHWSQRPGDDRCFLQVNYEEGLLGIGDDYLVPELLDIRNIMRECKANARIRAGDFSYQHV